MILKKIADHGLNKLMEGKKRDNHHRLRTGDESGASVRQGKAKIVENPEKTRLSVKTFPLPPKKKVTMKLTV